jgi:cyclophilin family peptidyl-prolyl cis-trans isomerase
MSPRCRVRPCLIDSSLRATCIGSPWRTLALVVATCVSAGCATLQPDAPPPRVESVFALQTSAGDLSIELFPAAAPQAVALLTELLAAGSYDGLLFDWVRPRIEIRIAAPPPPAPTTIPAELDATSVGLHLLRVEDEGRAMDLLQLELERAFMRQGPAATPQLREWIATWRAGFDAGFLVGTTRQEINEALGYRYREGLESRPAAAGAVVLIPAEPALATLALAILLRDQPARTGRWVVVGRVVEGLEVAEEISLERREHPRSHRPANPVSIRSAKLTPGR